MFQTKITRTEPYTLQEAFDRIWQFFVIENHPKCKDPNGAGCAYRSEDSACAIGCLLPDEAIHPFTNTAIVGELKRQSPIAAHLLRLIPDHTLQQLQSIHDSSWQGYGATGKITESFRVFAQDNNLSVPE